MNHTVFMVQEKGWSGMKNGELLRVAENEFDVWVTADQNIEYQQNLSRFNIAVVVLVAPNNRLETLLPMILKVTQSTIVHSTSSSCLHRILACRYK